MTPLDHALALAAEGFHVFPLRDGKPAHVGWQQEATTDPDAIRKLWGQDFNVGIFTGAEASSLLVVDVDVKNGKDGFQSVLALDLEGKELPPTREHATKSGGRHLIYRVAEPVRQRIGFRTGIDVKSRGGYVVGPGTPGYSVLNDRTIAYAPQWLVDECGKAADVGPPRAHEKLPGIDPQRAYRRAVEWLQDQEPVAAGSRNDAGFKAAAQLKDFGLDEPACLDTLLEHFRCVPMLELDEMRKIVGSAYTNSASPQGSAAPEAVFEAIKDTPSADTPSEPLYQFLTVDELMAQPAPEWLVRGLFPRQGLAVVYGAPGSGKSFLVLDIAAAIVRGIPWGEHRVRQGWVFYLALEGQLQSRVRAYLTRHGLVPVDLAKLEPLEKDASFNFLRDGGKDIKRLIPSIKARASNPAAVIIDTLSRATPGGNENASEDMGRAIKGAEVISRQLNCLVILVHHSGKNAGAGARGHSSLLGAADAELEVSRAADGVTRSVRVTKVKDGEDGRELSFRLESVDLGPTHDHDPDADPFERDSSCVVVDLAPANRKPGQKDRRWTQIRRNAYEALRRTLADRFEDELPTCTASEWQTAYYDATPLAEEAGTPEYDKAFGARRRSFGNAVDWLKGEKLARTVKKNGTTVYALGAEN